jgi:F-type H+-transporting ATPase subunit a
MSALALILGLALMGPMADLPATATDSPAVSEEDHAERDMGAAEIFSSLFKHLEPHAVGAVWMGGSKGFGLVKPYATLPDGSPAHLDDHGLPVGFHSAHEFDEHYAAAFGGGRGFLIYNINSVQWIAGGIVLLIFLMVARKAKRLGADAPRGVAYQMMESTVLFVRNEMVYAVMGKEAGRKFVPLFLTHFFFILCMNIMGLLYIGSLGGTATANIAVTAGLALTTLVFIHVSGIREHGFVKHWKNFIPHGLPWWVLPVIVPVEVLGMIVKPAALTIRLFANLTAGHLIMLSLFGLVYLAGGMMLGLPALAAISFAVAISCLELFVAFVQAYIFTYLSIIFVGASVHPDH